MTITIMKHLTCSLLPRRTNLGSSCDCFLPPSRHIVQLCEYPVPSSSRTIPQGRQHDLPSLDTRLCEGLIHKMPSRPQDYMETSNLDAFTASRWEKGSSTAISCIASELTVIRLSSRCVVALYLHASQLCYPTLTSFSPYCMAGSLSVCGQNKVRGGIFYT